MPATDTRALDLDGPLWSRINRGNPDICWEWLGHRNADGYGSLKISGREIKAHRAAWIYSGRGPIPDGLQVLHRCDNPSCCNPRHLFLGTNRDNVIDRQAKGRSKNLFTSENHPRRVLSDAMRDEVVRLRCQGWSQKRIASVMGVSRGYVAHLVAGVLPKNARCN